MSERKGAISPGQYFRVARAERRRALDEVKIQRIQPDGRVLISPGYSQTVAKEANLQDLLEKMTAGGRLIKITISS